MEQIAIFSDVHANLTALEAVLENIEKRNINKIICLGDLVYKGVCPEEVIDIVKDKCDIVLRGNCDAYIGNKDALDKKYWTRLRIGEKRAEYLRNLPIFHEFYLSGHLVRLFHAAPISLDALYNPMYSNKNSRGADREISDPEVMFKNTQLLGKTEKDPVPDIVGYGHIHTPHIVRFKNKTIFNTGSIGMPTEMLNTQEMDETTKFSRLASYVILEGEYKSRNMAPISINLVRVPYSIETEIARIEKSDNPRKEEIIRRLQTVEP